MDSRGVVGEERVPRRCGGLVVSHFVYSDEVAKGRLLEARKLGQRYVSSLARNYRSAASMTDVDAAGNEIRIGSHPKAIKRVASEVFGTGGVKDYLDTAGRAGRRAGAMRANATAAGKGPRSAAIRDANDMDARVDSMTTRGVGEAKRLRNVWAGVGAAGGAVGAGGIAAMHSDKPKQRYAPVVMPAAKAYTLSKAARKLPRDLAGMEAELARQAKATQAAIDHRDKVVAEHKPVMDAYDRQTQATKKPVRRKAPVTPVAAPAAPRKPRTRKKAVVPESLHLNPNPPRTRAPRAPRQSPDELRAGALRINENLRSSASPRQIRRGALIGAAVGGTVAGGAALYAMHRAKKKRAGQLVPVGKARLPKVGSLVRAPGIGGARARQAEVGLSSSGKRKLTYKTPIVATRDPAAPKPSYALHNFTTGPLWQGGAAVSAHPVRTTAAVTGGALALGGSFRAGRKSTDARYY